MFLQSANAGLQVRLEGQIESSKVALEEAAIVATQVGIFGNRIAKHLHRFMYVSHFCITWGINIRSEPMLICFLNRS